MKAAVVRNRKSVHLLFIMIPNAKQRATPVVGHSPAWLRNHDRLYDYAVVNDRDSAVMVLCRVSTLYKYLADIFRLLFPKYPASYWDVTGRNKSC